MKPQITLTLLFSSVIFLFSGCNKTPEKVCKNFLNAYLSGNFKEAATYANSDTKEILLLQQELLDLDLNNSTNDTTHIFTKPKMISIKTETDTDSTKVLFCKFYLGKHLDSTRVQMVFVNKQWLIQFPYTTK